MPYCSLPSDKPRRAQWLNAYRRCSTARRFARTFGVCLARLCVVRGAFTPGRLIQHCISELYQHYIRPAAEKYRRRIPWVMSARSLPTRSWSNEAWGAKSGRLYREYYIQNKNLPEKKKKPLSGFEAAQRDASYCGVSPLHHVRTQDWRERRRYIKRRATFL
mgnify:CR=1 FL=1